MFFPKKKIKGLLKTKRKREFLIIFCTKQKRWRREGAVLSLVLCDGEFYALKHTKNTQVTAIVYNQFVVTHVTACNIIFVHNRWTVGRRNVRWY